MAVHGFRGHPKHPPCPHHTINTPLSHLESHTPNNLLEFTTVSFKYSITLAKYTNYTQQSLTSVSCSHNFIISSVAYHCSLHSCHTLTACLVQSQMHIIKKQRITQKLNPPYKLYITQERTIQYYQHTDNYYNVVDN